MKTNFNLLLLITFLTVCTTLANAGTNKEKIIPTKIEKVTVYLNGAQIYRAGNISLTEGVNYIVVQNVSRKIVKEKIQAEISGAAKIMGIEYKEPYVKNGLKRDSLRIIRLGDSIRILDKELRRFSYLKSTYNAEKIVLEKNTLVAESNNAAVSYSLEVQKLTSFYSNRILELNKQLFLLSEEESNIHEKEEKIEKEIIRLEKEESNGEIVPQIKFTIYADAALVSTLNMNYIVGGAAWDPQYSMNVEEQSNQLNMDYNASVMNQSGENWNSVNLALSTADPNQSNTLPAINPWVINKHSKNLGEGNLDKFGSKKVSADVLKSQTGIEPLKGVELEEIAVPSVDIDFKIDGKYTIPSDGVAYTVTISKNKLQAKYDYYCIPKLEKDAFLVAQVSGWEKLNLLEGKTSTYYQGRYIGESNISPQYANDTLDISLGRTSKVLINRIKTEDKNSKKFLDNDIIETISYRTTIKNTNTTAISILVEDQLPISQSDDIKIESKEISKASLDTQNGELMWNLNLKPGESKELIVRFSVQYPKSKSSSFRLFYDDGIYKKRTRSKF